MAQAIKSNLPKIVFAGDRDIAVQVLKFILETGNKPLALLAAKSKNASHDKQLVKMCPFLHKSLILRGDEFRTERGIKLLNELKPDYIINVHFPYIYPGRVLKTAKRGVLNLHPAFLPFNRGWHTPTWAIWDKTPYGATLHFMDERLDTGDIVSQEKLEIRPDETAHELYQRVKKLELAMFKKAWPSLLSYNYKQQKQKVNAGTMHSRKDIKTIQSIVLKRHIKAEEIIRQLRALSTNNIKEAACFEANNKIYRIQVKIQEDKK